MRGIIRNESEVRVIETRQILEELQLKNVLGSTLLGDLGKNVLVPAFDLDNESKDKTRRCWKPKFFHNFKGRDSDRDVSAYKVALYTSAAPTYFPSVDGYIDGGVVCLHPAIWR